MPLSRLARLSLKPSSLAAETLAATALSVLALALTAKAERRALLQPLNATSHWLNGPGSAALTGFGWRTTGVGLATHFAATGFWAALYEAWLRRGERSRTAMIGKAAAMAGVSALVDYRATPRRFTPGWEFVLSPGSMVLVYAALSAGLALGATPPPWPKYRRRSGEPRDWKPASGAVLPAARSAADHAPARNTASTRRSGTSHIRATPA